MMQNNNNVPNVPYIVHESALARAERHARRLTIALTVAVIALAASNFAWMLALIR